VKVERISSDLFEGESARQDVLELEHGKLPDPVAREMNQLVEKFNRMPSGSRKSKSARTASKDKVGISTNGNQPEVALATPGEDPLAKEKY
jgi:hypothetical protein